MAKDLAQADREAAAYWRQVARVDRSEAGLAVANAKDLSAAARREDREPAAREVSTRASRVRLGS